MAPAVVTRIARRVLTGALCAAALLTLAPAAFAARQVSYAQLLRQVRSGPLIRVIINLRGKDAEIKFANLDEWRAYYPPGAQVQLERLVHARHIKLKFAGAPHKARRPGAAVHHHLRYIAAGVLAALVLASAGAWLYRRRSREAASAAAR